MGPQLLDYLQPCWLCEHTALVVKEKNGSWSLDAETLMEGPLELEYGLPAQWREQITRPVPCLQGTGETSHP